MINPGKRTTDVKLIRTDADYDSAIQEIESLIDLDPDPQTEEADRLTLLSLIVGEYDQKHFHFSQPNPISILKFVMEQRDLKRSDLIQYLGSQSKVSEVLSGKRKLSLRMMRALHAGLGIPYELMIGEPEYKSAAEKDKLVKIRSLRSQKRI